MIPCGAQVEHFLDGDFVTGRDADDTGNPMTHGLQDAKNIGCIQRPVFAINKQPVEPCVGKDFCRGCRRQRHHRAKQTFPVAESRSKTVGHGCWLQLRHELLLDRRPHSCDVIGMISGSSDTPRVMRERDNRRAACVSLPVQKRDTGGLTPLRSPDSFLAARSTNQHPHYVFSPIRIP